MSSLSKHQPQDHIWHISGCHSAPPWTVFCVWALGVLLWRVLQRDLNQFPLRLCQGEVAGNSRKASHRGFQNHFGKGSRCNISHLQVQVYGTVLKCITLKNIL